MAKILPEDSMPPRRRGRYEKYPWQDWADGQARVITQGEDYACKTRSMAVQIRQQAGARGLSAQVLMLGPTEEPNAIQFRMYRKVEKEAA